jgi:toxin YoeB
VRPRNPPSSSSRPAQRDIGGTSEFFDDFEYWLTEDVKTARRLLRLMRLTARDPFEGIGKPEPLKGMEGCWSRRLTSEHRFVYRVTPTMLVCLQARFHY